MRIRRACQSGCQVHVLALDAHRSFYPHATDDWIMHRHLCVLESTRGTGEFVERCYENEGQEGCKATSDYCRELSRRIYLGVCYKDIHRCHA